MSNLNDHVLISQNSYYYYYYVSGMAGPKEPRNVVCPSTFSNGAVIDSPHPTCEREVRGWKIILLQQGLGNTFELYQEWKALTQTCQQYSIFSLIWLL